MLPALMDAVSGSVARPDRACVDSSQGFCLPLASACLAVVVDIGRSLAAAGGLGTGLAGLVWRAVSGMPLRRALVALALPDELGPSGRAWL